MRIESEIKLDFKDVLFRPKRSVLRSRKQVDLNREYKFRNSHRSWKGIPIMAANMDGVGTFNMASELSFLNMFTCITKQASEKQWDENISKIDREFTATSSSNILGKVYTF